MHFEFEEAKNCSYLNFQSIQIKTQIRSFQFFLEGKERHLDDQIMKSLKALPYSIDDKGSESIDGIFSQLQIMEQKYPEYVGYFTKYQQLLQELKKIHTLGFVAFFPAMLLIDAIVETMKIGMVNYREL